MPKNKQLQFLEDAEKLYVESGLETITIEGILKGAVTRRSLDSWKDQYNWVKKRENYKSRMGNLKENVLDLINTTALAAQTEPTQKNIKAFKEMILLGMKLGIDLGLKNVEAASDKKIKKETIELIEREILGLG